MKNSIVVFGSANVDLVVRCARLPRPGETVTGSGHQMLPGGKGANQALAARRAGGDVSFCGAVGRDAFADTALANLIEAGVRLDGLHRIDAPTGLASISWMERRMWLATWPSSRASSSPMA